MGRGTGGGGRDGLVSFFVFRLHFFLLLSFEF